MAIQSWVGKAPGRDLGSFSQYRAFEQAPALGPPREISSIDREPLRGMLYTAAEDRLFEPRYDGYSSGRRQ